jgi:hypothetical protein
MILCGHQPGCSRRSDAAQTGQTINQILQNYQNYAEGGRGTIRMYVYRSDSGKVEIYTFNQFYEEYLNDSVNNFSVLYDEGSYDTVLAKPHKITMYNNIGDTFTIGNNTGNNLYRIKDTKVSSSAGTTNYGISNSLTVQSGGTEYLSLLRARFETAVPDNSLVEKAELTIYLYEEAREDRITAAKRMKTNWGIDDFSAGPWSSTADVNDSSPTYNHAFAQSIEWAEGAISSADWDTIVDTINIPIGSAVHTPYTLNLTELFQAWKEQEVPNFGFILNGSNTLNSDSYCSSEGMDGYRPEILIIVAQQIPVIDSIVCKTVRNLTQRYTARNGDTLKYYGKYFGNRSDSSAVFQNYTGNSRMTIIDWWSGGEIDSIYAVPEAGSPRGYYISRVRNSTRILSLDSGYNLRILVPSTGTVVLP